ncbi:MAG: Flp pilus assembly protein CpaB [Verrucomicrobiales bacterium]|jgi:Flp pilus assembly protein CpaB
MKNSFPIIVAIIIAVVSLLAVQSYVKRVNKETTEQLSGKLLLSAAVDIEKGEKLTELSIQAREVPDQFIPPQGIVGESQVRMAMGRTLKYPVAAGQLVLWSDLEMEKRGFSTVIPQGERGYTVSFSSGINTGFISPNDRIDIIASFSLPDTGEAIAGEELPSWRESSDMVNVVLLQNVTVLAVGDSFRGGGGGSSSGDLTLSLTLQEAQLIMFAEHHGELGAVLRKDGNVAPIEAVDLPKISFEQIEKIIGELEQKRKRRIVEIIQGGASTTVPVNPGN